MRRGLVYVMAIGGAVFTIGASALGWGGLGPLLAQPARIAFVLMTIAFSVIALASPVNLSSGRREVSAGRDSMLPAGIGFALLAWLMPYMDRRDLWTLDGDLARAAGVLLMLVGGILRVWPMFVLGHRFSGLVAIQENHDLVTDGLYRYVRHPSYLGMMLGMVGWALIFRSSVGLVGALVGLPLLIQRIDVEEAMLAANFGAPYEEYRRRTWRLVPGVY